MTFIYEVTCQASFNGKTINNVWHVGDPSESVSPGVIAGIFDTTWLAGYILNSCEELVWNTITVTAMDNINPAPDHVLSVNKVGQLTQDPLDNTQHMYARLESADPSFRSGGKLLAGISQVTTTNGQFTQVILDAMEQLIVDLLVDLIGNGMFGAIYRPSLSAPGLPAVSVISGVLTRGLSGNNRRFKGFQQ